MVYILIILGALFRILSNTTGFEVFPPNFAPIGAMALFGGFYLPKKQGLIIPLAALFLSDLVIGFYEPLVVFSVYSSFVAISFLGSLLAKYKDFKLTFGGILFSSFLFYFVTNAAVWANPGSSYADDLSGLLASLVSGLPFLKFTLMGDLLFNAGFFGSVIATKYLAKNNKFKFLINTKLV